jgi:hypothetical protein
MNQQLEKCYKAFDLLKMGRGTHEDCVALPLNEITFSRISQEAGHDRGYLKKNREQHKPLLSMLTLFLSELPADTTMSKSAALLRQKIKAKHAKDEAATMKVKLEASLGRELQLYHALKTSEEEVVELKLLLAKYSNVMQLPI